MFILLLKNAYLMDSLWWISDISPSYYHLNAFPQYLTKIFLSAH